VRIPTAFALILAASSGSVHADDTDIYFAAGGTLGGNPLVMFTLDYRSNLAARVCQGPECDFLRTTISPSSGTTYLPGSGPVSFFQLLRASLRKVMDDLGTQVAGVKLGIMLNHNDSTGGPCGSGPDGQCSNGAYVLMGFDANPERFHETLARIPEPQGNLAHPFQGKELYFELFRYLTGQAVFNGHKGWEDFGDSNADDNLDVDNPGTPFDDRLLRWDSTIENESGTAYVSPLRQHCSKVFVVNFLFQVSNQDNDSDTWIRKSKAEGGMNGFNPGTSNTAFADVIRWMRDVDLADGTYGTVGNLEDVQNVTSYFFVDPSKINTTTNGYASAGGTGTALPLSSDPSLLIDALKDMFKQILSVSATFVSASAPVNVFTRTETLSQVFFSLFQAEQTPRWNGNLKRLKLAVDPTTGNLRVLDASTPPIDAISGVDGRIKHEALTFWTDPSGFDLTNANYFDPAKGEVSGKDGRSVGRGGGGQKIPGFLSGSPGTANSETGARKIFTEPDTLVNGTATALRPVNGDFGTAAAVWDALRKNGANGTVTWSEAESYSTASSEEQTLAVNLLKFARGLDVQDENGNGNLTEAHPWATPANQPKRKWLMGDPLHSAPVPINYGARPGYSTTVPDVRILVSGNDGMLHLFRNSASGSGESEVPDGREDWAFLPRALLGNLKPLYDNGTTTSHLYGLDGSAAAYVNDRNRDGTVTPSEGDRVYAFVNMRRGGKGYYALDVSNPDDPKMLWSLAKEDAGFSELGLTFSDPVVTMLDWGEGRKPVVVFGGGYDTNKDRRSPENPKNAAAGSDDSEGNAIYVVDATSGTLVWKAIRGDSTGPVSVTTYQQALLRDSVPSKVNVIDTDDDGLADRLYVGDTGGVVWRADLAGTDRMQWKLSPVLSVGRHAGRPDRRFFHRPDFVPTSDGDHRFDAILIGSGDREHPLDTNVHNQFYLFRDRHTVGGVPPTSVKTPGDLDDLTDLAATADPAKAGWYIDLGTSASGEKALAAPVTYRNRVYFSTYVPQGGTVSGQCGPQEGQSLTYVVNLHNASGVFNFDTTTPAHERSVITGSGIPSSPVVVAVGGNLYVTAGNLPPHPDLSSPIDRSGIQRIFWYEKE
jgi:type IV pilus assembly protein PilY1